LSEQQTNAELGQEPLPGQAEAAAAPVEGPEAQAAAAGRAESAAPRQPSGPQLRIPSRPDHSAPDPRVTELEAQVAEAKQQLQRMAADFENYRRRVAAEKDELVSFASSRVLENFLPIVDNFERALQHAATAEPSPFQQGIEMIYRQVIDFLGRQGVAQMDVVGKLFDPNVHEAIAQFETPDHPDQSILAVAEKGYSLNGRVLRHAKVQIASNSAERAAAEAEAAAAAAAAQAAAAVEAENAALSNTIDQLTAELEGASPPETVSSKQEDFTLEDLMAEAAQDPQGSKEESHG